MTQFRCEVDLLLQMVEYVMTGVNVYTPMDLFMQFN